MSEKGESKRDGSRLVKNSGRGLDKGDAILEPFLIDYKEYSKSFSLSRAVWLKVSKDAASNGMREPTLKIVLGDEGAPRLRLWVISDAMFQEMREAWLEKYGES